MVPFFAHESQMKEICCLNSPRVFVLDEPEYQKRLPVVRANRWPNISPPSYSRGKYKTLIMRKKITEMGASHWI